MQVQESVKFRGTVVAAVDKKEAALKRAHRETSGRAMRWIRMEMWKTATDTRDLVRRKEEAVQDWRSRPEQMDRQWFGAV